MSSQDAINEFIEQAPASAAPNLLVRWLRAPAAYLRARPRMAILVGAGLVLFTAGSVAGWLIYRSAGREPERTVAAALELIDQGDFAAAKPLAEKLARRAQEPGFPASGAYVLGVLAFDDAAKAASAARKAMYLAAGRYLEAALGNGLDEERRGHAWWLLGRALFEAGETSTCQAALIEALHAQPHRAAEIRPLLVDAYLRDSPPKLAEALEQNRLILAQEDLPEFQRVAALLRQAEMLLDADRADECLQTLAAVPRDSFRVADACVLRGRALLQQARALRRKAAKDASAEEVNQKLQAAHAALSEAIHGDPRLGSAAGRQAAYLAAVCLTELGDTAGALKLLAQFRSAEPATPEHLAAAFQEGELLQGLHRDAEAAEAYCRALDAVGDPKAFRNPWVPLGQLGDRVREMTRRLRDARNFPLASELATRAARALPEDQGVEMQAEIHRDWGRDLVAQAEKVDASASAALARDGRQHLRRAARLWRRLAQLRAATRLYPDEVWESARCAMDGRDYRLAVEMLEEYIKVDPRGRQSQALADLGEALLSLGRTDKAIAALRDCFERFARDVSAPRARLLAGQALLEQGDVAAAQQMLEANLSSDMLTPASSEYGQSLFLLGKLFYRARRYSEALPPLEEAVQRYPDAPQTIEARYSIADCHRLIALSEKQKLHGDLVEPSRAARQRRIEDELNASLEGYRQTQKALQKRQESGSLSRLEALMLRNCYFFIGSALADLGQFDAAAEAYSQAVHRYPGAPETLEALVQLARALYAANKPAEAREAVDQARFLLARMKPDAPLEQTTNYTRSQWVGRLEQLAAQP